MILFKSIRWRLQMWHGIILVLVLAGFGLTAYHLERSQQLQRVDRELQQIVQMILGEMRAGGPPEHPPPLEWSPGHPPGRNAIGNHPPPPHEFRLPPHLLYLFAEWPTNTLYYRVWVRDGTVLQRSLMGPDEVPLPPRYEGLTAMPSRTRGNFREAYVFTPPGECALVGRSIALEIVQLHRFALWLSAAGAGVLVAGLAGGWWLSTRAIRPIAAISAAASKISEGDLAQRISVAETESELGRLAAVLNTTFGRLEAAFAQRARFTADASHELRTPVSVMLSQTQTALARERTPGEYRETLEACQRAAQRMRRLIESLLELARLDAAQEPMKRERLDLAQVAAESVELIRPLAAQRAIQIQCALPSIPCIGDAERLGQVVTNLLTNAIHFNRENGRIDVSASVQNGTARLAVSDNGEGILPEDLPHVFERFYRADKSRSRAQGRTGLGLAICKAIVDAHSGTMEVMSTAGKGATFVVHLPIV